MRTLVLSLALAAASMSGAARAGNDLLAVSSPGDVYTIDSMTGQGQLINGARRYRDLNCLAKRADGVMFAMSGGELITIDEFSGQMEPVITTSLDYVRGLAFGPDGKLYGINDGGVAMPDVLYRIDPASGATTLIGAASHARLQGMAINSSGKAFVWDTESGLLRLELETGATSDVNAQLDGSHDIESLAFSAGGELLGCAYGLYSLDVQSGARTYIGAGGYIGVRGIAFIGSAGGYALRAGGRCPGEVTVEWWGATAERRQALIFGAAQGGTIIPGGVCQGAMLGIQGGVRIVHTFGTGSGRGIISGSAGTGACGGWLQLVQVPGCAVSNDAQVP